MKRRIVDRLCHVEEVPVDSDWQLDTWLLSQARDRGLATLLAHADDGLIWGEVRHDGLHLSSAAFSQVSPPLRTKTLQQLWLFGPSADLSVWRAADGEWQARLIQDGVGQACQTFDEYQMLWGTRSEGERDGFTLLVDGQLGNRHAPPVPEDRLAFGRDGSRRPLRLQVRHYLHTDPETGLMSVYLSRLVAVLPHTEVKS